MVADDIDFKDKYLRALAALENARKSKAKEVLEARRAGEIAVILEILPVVDDLHRAMEAMNEKRVRKKDVLSGVNLVFSKFNSTLKRLFVEELQCEGQKFSCETMDAVAQVSTDKVLPGLVVNEIERGYTIGGALLRPAKVSVAVETGKNA